MFDVVQFAMSIVGSRSSPLIRSVMSCVQCLSPITEDEVNWRLECLGGGPARWWSSGLTLAEMAKVSA